MKLTSASLRRAADIQDEIEKLQSELDQMFETGESPAPPSDSVVIRRPRRKVARRADASVAAPVRRNASPSGPLAPAVVKVLKAHKRPMSVAEIVEGLEKNGYQFITAQPRKNLAVRIYKLKGVKQVGPGRFSAA
ncbi:MAG TPA: hypothetical protein VN957_25110 [Chthoniobacterales bacterium]|jgi:hypothetical protein|nr:hypothetical protein [Chthoniobacterales bacterium]